MPRLWADRERLHLVAGEPGFATGPVRVGATEAIGEVTLHNGPELRATLEAYGGGQVTIYGEGEPFRVNGLSATAGLFAALRIVPVLGRALTADDARQVAQRVDQITRRELPPRVGIRANAEQDVFHHARGANGAGVRVTIDFLRSL